MLYKTILLELIESRPALHKRLKQQRAVLVTVDRLAVNLKARHEAWSEVCAQQNPSLDPVQAASLAGELALEEIMTLLESDCDEVTAGPQPDLSAG